LRFYLTFWAFTKRHTTFIFASFVNAVLDDGAAKKIPTSSRVFGSLKSCLERYEY
jgi:hypothetical protein